MEELGSLFDRHSTDRARSRITYAPVSPHIEILIRGNCESLFPSCVPRIRYDATPRHVTPRTSCYRDFLLSRQQKDTKRSETIASEQDLRDYVYILPLFFSSPEENSMGIWRVIGFLAARNSMTLFVPDPSQLPNFHRPDELCEFGDVIFQEIFDASLTAGKSRVWFFSNIHALRSVSSISRLVSTALIKISLFDEQEELNNEE